MQVVTDCIGADMLGTQPSLPGSAPSASSVATSSAAPSPHATRSGVRPSEYLDPSMPAAAAAAADAKRAADATDTTDATNGPAISKSGNSRRRG